MSCVEVIQPWDCYLLPLTYIQTSLVSQRQESQEEDEDDVIVLDGSDSSGDEIEVLLLEEIEQSKPSSNESKKAAETVALNNNDNLPQGPGLRVKTEGTSDLSNNNDDAQKGDEEIIVETILERISSESSEQREVSGKQLQVKVPQSDEHQAKSSGSKTVIIDSRQPIKTVQPREVDQLRTATVCKICSNLYRSRREFQDHLAAQHFRPELEREILRAGPGQTSCPSCSHFKSKDLTELIVHYGARCKPFPVNKLYSNWLSRSALGFSSDICVFCGARAHSPNDLVFHLIDKHVGDVLKKMYFNFFFKHKKVRD